MNDVFLEFFRRIVRLVKAPPTTQRHVDKDGNIIFVNAENKLSRKIGPAYIGKDGSKHWALDGSFFRLFGPAKNVKGDFRAWYDSKGRMHRFYGPCVEGDQKKMIEMYAMHGVIYFKGDTIKKYKDDCYIVQDKDGDKKWHRQTALHRDDGPAVVNIDGTKEWWVNNKRHREDGPAVEKADGTKEWWCNDKRHRDAAPAIEYSDGFQEWWKNGKLSPPDGEEVFTQRDGIRCWMNEQSQLHREDGPAVVYPDGGEKWFKNGKIHRVGGPAKIVPVKQLPTGKPWGVKKWFIDGKLHREDGPAVEFADGTNKWYINDRLHRADGPAVEWRRMKLWYLNGKLHRDNGPAVEYFYGDVESDVVREWWLRGKLHRHDGPAIEIGSVPDRLLQRFDATQREMLKYHSVTRWLVEHYYGDTEWWLNGKRHRQGAPAVCEINGTEKWYSYGNLHREDGPAVTYPAGSKEWWIRGRLHRKEGPAVEVAEGYNVLRRKNYGACEAVHRLSYYHSGEVIATPPPSSLNKTDLLHASSEWWLMGKRLDEDAWKKAVMRPTL